MTHSAPGPALLLATALLFAPASVSAQDVSAQDTWVPGAALASHEEPLQPLQRERYRPTWSLVTAGVIVAAVMYASAFVHADRFGMIIRGQDFTDWLRVPVIGPWVAAGHHHRADFQATLALVGIAQLTGLALIAAGLAIDQGGAEVVVTPVAAPTAAGIAASGRF